VNENTQRYGRRRERRWTTTRAKAQDTKASPNSLEKLYYDQTKNKEIKKLRK